MPFEFVKADTHIDFMGKRRIAAVSSIGLLLASFVFVFINGIHLGIDFAGGTEVQLQFAPSVDVSDRDVRAVMSDALGIQKSDVVRYGEAADNAFLVRFQGNINEEVPNAPEDGAGEGEADVLGTDLIVQLEAAMRGAIGEVSIERVEFVGPRVGEELREDGLKAILYASLAILIYIAFRFNTRFAPGAIVAVIHDLLITGGIFVILGMEFDLRILAAMLAILGYSLNDTIIIYDRIRENMELHTAVALPQVLNESVNQTLSRTLLTSGTTLIALTSLYFLGGEVIRPFAFAMIIGIIVGTYSSIYIASPVLLWLENRFGRSATAQAAVAKRKQQHSRAASGRSQRKARSA